MQYGVRMYHSILLSILVCKGRFYSKNIVILEHTRNIVILEHTRNIVILEHTRNIVILEHTRNAKSMQKRFRF